MLSSFSHILRGSWYVGKGVWFVGCDPKNTASLSLPSVAQRRESLFLDCYSSLSTCAWQIHSHLPFQQMTAETRSTNAFAKSWSETAIAWRSKQDGTFVGNVRLPAVIAVSWSCTIVVTVGVNNILLVRVCAGHMGGFLIVKLSKQGYHFIKFPIYVSI